jgi:hypothetical protein
MLDNFKSEFEQKFMSVQENTTLMRFKIEKNKEKHIDKINQ